MDNINDASVAEERSAYGNGHIKLYRSLLDSSLFAMRSEDLKIAIFLLLKANWKDAEWHNKWEHKRVTILRGELVTSLETISLGTNLTMRKVRTGIQHLVEDGFILLLKNSEKSTQRFTHVKICNYETYQSFQFEIDKRPTQDRHKSDIRPTTNEEYIRINKNKKKDIYTPLFIEFWEIYPRKESKKEAATAWSKLTPEAIEQLLKVIRNGYTWNENPRFIPYPATWLNQERWKDVQHHPEKKPYDPADDPIAALARSKK